MPDKNTAIAPASERRGERSVSVLQKCDGKIVYKPWDIPRELCLDHLSPEEGCRRKPGVIGTGYFTGTIFRNPTNSSNVSKAYKEPSVKTTRIVFNDHSSEGLRRVGIAVEMKTLTTVLSKLG